jgi:transposase
MFALGAATRVYVATGIRDMRIGFDGHYGKIRDVLECDPTSGHIFLFSNARRNRLKPVFCDGSGLWVCSKRMEGGRLYRPAPVGNEKCLQLSPEHFALLIGSIDLIQTR